jgi:hypothetical protein
MANYNAMSAVALDDGGSRVLMYDNYFLYGRWGVGESCHNSQWVYGVGNLYGYTTSGSLIISEGPVSPLGIRTFFYNNTFLNQRDSDWCNMNSWNNGTRLNLTQWWSNEVHSPTGEATGQGCRGGNNTIRGPMPDTEATARATAILLPYPRETK